MTGSVKLKILLVDDHGVTRQGIINSLSPNLPVTEFREASNASEALQEIHETIFDLVILDISMPGRNGLEVLKKIKDAHPEIPVIIFTMYPEDQFAIRSIRNGASAYLTKDISIKQLIEAIQKVLKGQRYLTPEVIELITNNVQNDQDVYTHHVLSNREFQVFRLIASGGTVSDIARELSLSVKTISAYRSNILKKMSLKNNSQITNYAFKNKLLP